MLKIKIGEQKPINYSIKSKQTGLPINLVNSIIIFQLKDKEEEITNFLLEKTITESSDPQEVGQIIDPVNGKFSVFFKSEDSLKLNINQEYYYTIWRIFENKKEVISSSGFAVEKFFVCPA